MGKFIELWWEANWRLFAYGVGGLLFSIFYLISLMVTPLKSIVDDYKNEAANKSVLTINFISTTIFTGLFSRIDPDIRYSDLFWLYLVWLILGFLALSLLAGYLNENKK